MIHSETERRDDVFAYDREIVSCGDISAEQNGVMGSHTIEDSSCRDTDDAKPAKARRRGTILGVVLIT
ncbi:hypothetical protein TNCV_4932201 [Trichonephila clavipes]|nr:hypothetical protein TNCV_4932201 [Trichonephila clavipes]